MQKLEGVLLNHHVTRKGSIGEEFTHVEGAVDRITHEIARNLEEKDVIVVWLMDASLSLIEERQAVAENLESVFAEIDQLGLVADDELVNAVVAFGHKPVPLVEPTSSRHWLDAAGCFRRQSLHMVVAASIMSSSTLCRPESRGSARFGPRGAGTARSDSGPSGSVLGDAP